MNSSVPDPALISLERHGAVAVLVLERPPVNAFDPHLVDGLAEAVAAVAQDRSVRCVLFRGAGSVFSAGADIAMLAGLAGTADGARAATMHVERIQQVFAAVEALPVPTVAALQGAATGGGFELALSCDYRIAATEARLGLPEVGLGLIPGAGGTQRITRLAGPGVAARLVLGAELVDGAEAARIGLVQKAVPGAELGAAALRLAERIASYPRAALVAAKRCLGAGNADGFGEELVAVRELVASSETADLLSAFVDRRRTRLAG